MRHFWQIFKKNTKRIPFCIVLGISSELCIVRSRTYRTGFFFCSCVLLLQAPKSQLSMILRNSKVGKLDASPLLLLGFSLRKHFDQSYWGGYVLNTESSNLQSKQWQPLQQWQNNLIRWRIQEVSCYEPQMVQGQYSLWTALECALCWNQVDFECLLLLQLTDWWKKGDNLSATLHYRLFAISSSAAAGMA